MKKNIDVIICTNKKLISIERLIKQIFANKGNFLINVIIIHQSNSVNLFPNVLRNKNIIYKKIKKQNLSIAKNIGLKLAKSDNISFLDDDVSIKNNYFLECINFYKNKKCDLLFSKIIQKKSLKPLSRNMGDHDIKINFLNSSCCLSSSMWIFLKNKKKFFFDEKFGLGAKYGSGEETDFVFNYLKMKKKIYYFAKGMIYHPDQFTETKNLKQVKEKFYSYGMGQGAIIKKNYQKLKLLSLLLFIITLVKSIIMTISYLVLFDRNNMNKYFSLLKGKVSGFIKYNYNLSENRK